MLPSDMHLEMIKSSNCLTTNSAFTSLRVAAGGCWSSSPSLQHPSSPFLFSPSTLDHLLNFQHQEEDLETRQPVDLDPPEPEIVSLLQT